MNSRHAFNSEEYKQAVLRARAMSGEEKLLEDARLFQEECVQMQAAIREEMPELCEEVVQFELNKTFAEAHRDEWRKLLLSELESRVAA